MITTKQPIKSIYSAHDNRYYTAGYNWNNSVYSNRYHTADYNWNNHTVDYNWNNNYYYHTADYNWSDLVLLMEDRMDGGL